MLTWRIQRWHDSRPHDASKGKTRHPEVTWHIQRWHDLRSHDHFRGSKRNDTGDMNHWEVTWIMTTVRIQRWHETFRGTWPIQSWHDLCNRHVTSCHVTSECAIRCVHMKIMKVLGDTVCAYMCWATGNTVYEMAVIQRKASVCICICKFRMWVREKIPLTGA